eukprot:6420719-Alexandrium_andersonii.AAC.1
MQPCHLGGEQFLTFAPEYCFMPNGDLWQELARVVHAKGCGALSVVKVKSHQDPPEDRASPEFLLWEGNDLADQAADMGA